MGKNNKLINSINMMAKRKEHENIMRASDKLVPHIYAGIALALHRECGWGYTRITRIFGESQRIWEEIGGDSMVELCELETGITLTNGEES